MKQTTRKKLRKILSTSLALFMLLGMMNVSVFAEESGSGFTGIHGDTIIDKMGVDSGGKRSEIQESEPAEPEITESETVKPDTDESEATEPETSEDSGGETPEGNVSPEDEVQENSEMTGDEESESDEINAISESGGTPLMYDNTPVPEEQCFVIDDNNHHTLQFTENKPWKGTLEISGSSTFVTITGEGTIDATGNDSSAILAYKGAKITLEGNVTITGGIGTQVSKNGVNKQSSNDNLNGYSAIIPDKRGTIRCGGGILLLDESSLTMNSGHITENEADQGGGICAFRGANVEIYGGTISKNTTTQYAGGGMYLAGKKNVIDPTKNQNNQNVEISNNCIKNSTQDLGGGGIFLESKGRLAIKNAEIYDNSADGLGGGVAGCLHAMVSIVTEDNAAIYRNTASGKNQLRTTVDQGDQKTTWTEELKSAGKDYFVAGYSLVGPHTLGGGFAEWEGIALRDTPEPEATKKNEEIYATEHGEIEVEGLLGLTVQNGDKVEAAAKTNKENHTVITNNHSTMHGGGIGTNGLLTFSEENYQYTYSDNAVNIVAAKTVTGASNSKINTSPDGYTFELTKDDGTKLGSTTSKNGGKIKFKNISTSALFGTDKTEGNVETHLILKEIDDGKHTNVKYDMTERHITVQAIRSVQNRTISTGTNGNTMTVYTVTDELTGVTVEKNDQAISNGAELNGTPPTIILNNDANFTNTLALGNLVIQKEIDLNGPEVGNGNGITDETVKAFGEATFTFKVTGPNNYDEQYKLKFAKGKCEPVTISGIPEGVYKISEIKSSDVKNFKWVRMSKSGKVGEEGNEYVLNDTGDTNDTDDTIEVKTGTTTYFTATNYYEVKNSGFSLKKVVDLDGNINMDSSLLDDLTFEFVLKGMSYDNNYQPTFLIRLNKQNNWSYQATSIVDNESINGIPDGKYYLYEKSMPDVKYFDPGSVSYTVNGQVFENEQGKTGISIEIGDDTEVNVVATNTYHAKQTNLSLTKKLEVDGKELNTTNKPSFENKEYTFELELVTPADGFSTYESESKTVTAGDTKTFSDLPMGTYKLKETRDNGVKNYTWNSVAVIQDDATLTPEKDGSFIIDLTDENDGKTLEVIAENSYSLKTGNVTVHKDVTMDGTEYGEDGERIVENFHFFLRGKTLNGEDYEKEIEVKYGEKATFENVPYGTYTVTEDMKAAGVDYYNFGAVTFKSGQDAEEKRVTQEEIESGAKDAESASFVLDDENNSEDVIVKLDVTNEYVRKLADLNITKVISGSGMDYNSVYDFTVALKSPAGYVTLADEYKYTVKDSEGNLVEGKGGTITPLKVLDENGNDTGENQTVELNGGKYTVYGTVADLGQNETATITGLPVGVKWHVVEVQENQDFNTTYTYQDGVVYETGKNSVVVTNSKNASPRTSVNVQKVWAGDTANRRPDSITVQLTKDGSPVDGKTKTLSADNGWRTNWSGLAYGPRYGAVEIGDYPGYTASVTEDSHGTTVNVTITNTYEPDTDIPDDDTPLSDIPDDDTPLSDIPDDGTPLSDIPDDGTPLSNIPDDDTPLSDLPDDDVPLTDLPEPDVPLADMPDDDVSLTNLPDTDVPLVNMPDEDVPLAKISDKNEPKTGDDSRMDFWLALALCSAFGIAFFGWRLKSRNKNKNADDN